MRRNIMKKYTAQEIVKRAYQIADIENTDFLQHREVTQYLNDSWQKVYQWLINKGDKQFVEEVKLNGTGGFGSMIEYDLPDNFYQMLSIRNASGYVIPRKSESESNNSCTYEIVNDKLRLYGCPGNLVLTYWTAPIWITFPDKDVEVNNVSTTAEINRAHCKNSIIDPTSKLIVNALTGDTIADVSTTLTNYSQYSFRLGKGHFTASKPGVTYYFDFDGHLIDSQHNHEYDTQEDFLCGTKVVYMSTSSCVNFMGTKVGEVDFEEENRIIGGDEDVLFNAYGEFNMNWMDAATYLSNPYHGYMDDIHANYDLLDVTSLGNRTYLFTANKGQFLYVHINEDGTYDWDKLNTIGAQIAPLEYGPLLYTGEHTLKSAYPDTVFNFPNEIYVQLISADLASRFLMKMNADSTGVDNLYSTMQKTFMNTLSQDGGYERIKNAYRS